jgi:hypothetical protein
VSIEVVERETTQMLAAIEHCLDGKFIMPALILIYSTIDNLAWLAPDVTHDDVTRSDFISWVGKFLLPGSGLSCTGTDLYAARCATLHSYSAESKLSREGRAQEIYYAWGISDEKELQRAIELVGTHDATAIHVDRLFAALRLGADAFFASVRHDDRVRRKVEKRFTNIPPLKLAS